MCCLCRRWWLLRDGAYPLFPLVRGCFNPGSSTRAEPGIIRGSAGFLVDPSSSPWESRARGEQVLVELPHMEFVADLAQCTKLCPVSADRHILVEQALITGLVIGATLDEFEDLVKTTTHLFEVGIPRIFQVFPQELDNGAVSGLRLAELF